MRSRTEPKISIQQHLADPNKKPRTTRTLVNTNSIAQVVIAVIEHEIDINKFAEMYDKIIDVLLKGDDKISKHYDDQLE